MPAHHRLSYLFAFLALACLALSLGGAGGGLAAAGGSEKIEAALMARLLAEGQSDFIVRFSEQADLSAAYGMEWGERGHYVYDTLSETAERSQARAWTSLEARGVRYQSFMAGNDIYVHGGNLESAAALARLDEVAVLIVPRTYAITPLEAANPVQASTWAGELLANYAETTAGLPENFRWNIGNTNVDDYWTAFDNYGENILVANIDTGVRYTHEALAIRYACYDQPSHTNCWLNPDDETSLTPIDVNGHGTHTMGTMVGLSPDEFYQIGMAPNAQWIACQGCDGTGCDAIDLAACADWILAPGDDPANRPQVVNNSWGSTVDGDDWFVPYVEAWRAAGIFPAFSAGNHGPLCGTMGDPGSYQQSFASAAHDDDEIEYSIGSRGPSAFGHDPYTKPNISAPGVDITSSYFSNDSSYVAMNGTSMASPHTAGAVALLWSCNPALVGQIDLTFRILQDSAREPRLSTCGSPPDLEGNYSFGYGYLDVMNAGMLACGNLLTGTLSGSVYDAEGSPLVGATVKAVSSEHSTQALTNASGAYAMTLVAGTYELTAGMNGYADQVVTGVEVAFEQTTIQDFYLEFLGLWTQVDPISCANLTRFDAEYFPGTGLVYILGGRYDTSQTTSTTVAHIYVFDPNTMTCTDTAADMPTPISNYTVNLVNDSVKDLLCTFGGRRADGTQTLEVQCYDPLANSATVVTSLPAEFASFTPGAQVVYNNQVYIFGGINPSLLAPYNLNRTFRYDPTSKTFTALGNLSVARGYIIAGEVDGRIYAFGGDTYNGFYLVSQTITEVMVDPEGAGVWDNAGVADLPFSAGEGRAFGFDSDSGYDLAGQIVLTTQAMWPNPSWEVFVYDVLSDSYDLSYPNLNVARRNHAGVFIPTSTSDPTDSLPGMWVFGGFCSGGTCGGDYAPYAPPEFFPVYLVNRIFTPLVQK
jgi:subtilisin family serine protease